MACRRRRQAVRAPLAAAGGQAPSPRPLQLPLKTDWPATTGRLACAMAARSVCPAAAGVPDGRDLAQLSVDVPACGVPASGTEGYSMYLRAEYLLVRRGTEGTHQQRGPAPAGKCGSCHACHMRGSRSSCRPVGHGVASAGGGSSPQKLRKFLYKFCAR